MDTVTDALLQARARVVHDLAACGMDTGACVSVVDDAVSSRRWWADEWPQGAQFLTCLVAQDVQEALLEPVGRWPLCTAGHTDEDDVLEHELRVTPDLGEDPHWVCEESGVVVARVGDLPASG
jgi:hypothetical protein